LGILRENLDSTQNILDPWIHQINRWRYHDFTRL